MKAYLLTSLFSHYALWLSLIRLGSTADKAQNPLPSEVSSYLTSFGYLPKPASGTSNLRTEKYVRRAIKRMQKFAGLKPTGEVDEETKNLMSTKRCGFPDFQFEEPPQGGHRRRLNRRRRFALQGSIWDHSNLTYRIVNHSPRLGPGRVRRVIHDALKQWADVSGLTFRETLNDEADIQVSFSSRAHGDGYPFDGPDVVLAHAFFPGAGLGGDAHFDNDELWTDKTLKTEYSQDVNLFSVGTHEFGHSLGLSHSNVQDSLMYPYYRYESKERMLHYDDIVAIQKLYGRGGHAAPKKPKPTETPTSLFTNPATHPPTSTQPTTTVKGPPNVCHSKIDAISRIRNEIFVFKDRHFWRFDDKGYLIENPVALDRFWIGLPENLTRVDAVYEPRKSDTIVFFTGRQYWKFVANQRLPGFPRDISELGLPSSIEKVDAAFVWEYNEATYIFSGDQYWRFDEKKQTVELDYPRKVDLWRNVPYMADSAYTDKSGITYFFKDSNVYRFNNYFMRVERGYPMKIDKYWTHCNSELKLRYDFQRQLGISINSSPVLLCIFLLFALLSPF